MFDKLEQFLRERFDLGPDFHIWKVEAVGCGNPEDVIVLTTGAICPCVYKSGPRKGRVNYHKREGSERVLPITLAKYREIYP